LGIVFELVLILLNFVLPDCWLSVEVRNFTIVTHFPLFMIMEGLRFGGSAPTAILGLLIALAVMGSVWGFLIYLVTRLIKGLLSRFVVSQRQRLILKYGIGLLGVVILFWTVIANWPATPIPFTASPEVKSTVDGNTTFALDLYQKLKDKPGNLFFSPYIVSTSLAMVSGGARGQTEMEMTNILHFNLPSEKLHPAFRALAWRMDKIQRWNRIVLKPASSIWCQQGHEFAGTFLKLVRENYSAEARPVDFKNPGMTAAEINRWIEEKTGHRIKGGIASEQLTPDLGLVLCDAIYFKGKWQHPFKKKDTKPLPFQVTTNESVTVPMMYQHSAARHAMSEDYSLEMLELPYVGQDLSMIILLPSRIEYVPDAEHNDVHDLEQKLTSENLRKWLAKLDASNPRKTSVRLPRFTTKSSFNLSDELKSLGIKTAFGDTANFSGMDGTKLLYLSDVFHQAFVEVNESGTEATAVNLALVRTAGMDDRFIVDHPFIFLIRENGSGSILFLGRIVDPTK
jgi:serpin B